MKKTTISDLKKAASTLTPSNIYAILAMPIVQETLNNWHNLPIRTGYLGEFAGFKRMDDKDFGFKKK